MRIAGTSSCSFNNGFGARYVVFVQGCEHHCLGCQNQDTWDFNGGKEIDVKDLAIDVLKHKHIDGVTLSGGDPFYQQEECIAFLKLLPKNLDVWIYTGFSYEEIANSELAKMANYIVDGEFEQDKIISDKMYGSSNQRIIKIK